MFNILCFELVFNLLNGIKDVAQETTHILLYKLSGSKKCSFDFKKEKKKKTVKLTGMISTEIILFSIILK